jgi:hypothetical protein
MRILSVHEDAIPISSAIRNAWIDFSSLAIGLSKWADAAQGL